MSTEIPSGTGRWAKEEGYREVAAVFEAMFAAHLADPARDAVPAVRQASLVSIGPLALEDLALVELGFGHWASM